MFRLHFGRLFVKHLKVNTLSLSMMQNFVIYGCIFEVKWQSGMKRSPGDDQGCL